jgi:hypothetical protein
MKTTSIIRVTILLAAGLLVRAAGAQTWPASGVYRIVSGDFMACCGIVGPVHTRCPYTEQALVALTVDPQLNLAQMRILGDDESTVFSVTEPGLGSFAYSLGNGIVGPDAVQFGDESLPPIPPLAAYGFTITSNGVGSLLISGTVKLPTTCWDCFSQFTHQNLVAELEATTTPSIRVSEVEICWPTVSNWNYQVQYQSALTTNAWMNVGGALPGSGSTQCITDKVLPGDAQRFYRVRRLP